MQLAVVEDLDSRSGELPCRIYDPERADAYEKLGLHTICPTLEGAKHIEKSLMEK